MWSKSQATDGARGAGARRSGVQCKARQGWDTQGGVWYIIVQAQGKTTQRAVCGARYRAKCGTEQRHYA